MDGVFSYFVAIGAGLTTGFVVVLLPTIWVYNKFLKARAERKGGKQDAITAIIGK